MYIPEFISESDQRAGENSGRLFAWRKGSTPVKC